MAKLMPIDDVVDCKFRRGDHCKKDGRAYQLPWEHWLSYFPALCPLSDERLIGSECQICHGTGKRTIKE